MSVSFSRPVIGVESKEVRHRFSKSTGHPFKLFDEGAFHPRSIRLRKSTEIPTSSAKSSASCRLRRESGELGFRIVSLN